MTNNGSPTLQRYVPLACWIIVLLTSVFICLKIISYGYMPPGDARRHVAKPFAHKPYSEIVVMKPQYVVDHSPGWEWFLGLIHRTLGWDEDALLSFSLTATLLWVLCLPLVWIRRPEAWMAAVLAELVALPNLMPRWAQARPYLVTEGVLIAFLFSWSNEERKNPPWWKLVLTCAGFALSVWMHGAWYLWVLLLAAFFLARRWRAALWLTVCWVAGTIVGALLTGKPIAFLYGSVFMAWSVYHEHVPKWMLVGEFQPSVGEFATLTLMALLYLWLKLEKKPLRALTPQPVFWMILINWIASFTADRFWADWGLPSVIVWVAMQFDEVMPSLWATGSIKRVIVCCLVAAPLFIGATNDIARRYTYWTEETFLDAADPKLKGWFPEKNGIFFASDMVFFYNTFYKNPTADWRYILGFEPALMPDKFLKTYRDIQRDSGAWGAYDGWIKEMHPEDRLAIEGSTKPLLTSLEWIQASRDLWIGRLPRKEVKTHGK